MFFCFFAPLISSTTHHLRKAASPDGVESYTDHLSEIQSDDLLCFCQDAPSKITLPNGATVRLIDEVIGQGSYGSVSLGELIARRTKTTTPVVLKRFDTLDRNTDRYFFNREVAFLKKVNRHRGHESIVEMLHSFDDPITERFTIILEMLGPNLAEVLQQYHEDGLEMSCLKTVARCALSALKHCHESNVIHCDVKLENLVMADPVWIPSVESFTDDYRVKLIDFGLACSTDSPNRALCGTRGYIPPEVILDLFKSPACDIWSMAITLYSLRTNRALFPRDSHWCMVPCSNLFLSDLVEYQRSVGEKLPQSMLDSSKYRSEGLAWFPPKDSLSDAKLRSTLLEPMGGPLFDDGRSGYYLYRIIKDMLKMDPDSRPTASELLAHPFFRGNTPICSCS